MVAIKSLFAAAAAHYAGSWSSGSSGGNYGNYGKDANPGAVAGYDWSMQHHTWAGEGIANCKIDKFVPNFPHGQNQLVAPSTPPRFIGLAFGVQNYTCTPAGNYTSAGAVAELIDVSCQVYEPGFDTIQHDLYNVWTKLIPHPIEAIIDLLHLLNPPYVLNQHYFVPNPVTGEGLSPKWDFTSSGAFQGVKDAFIIAKGKASIPAPTDPKKDVAWLDVVNVDGKIADEVFRFDTVGGQPPSSCVYNGPYGNDLSVKYVSKYIFYGGSISYA